MELRKISYYFVIGLAMTGTLCLAMNDLKTFRHSLSYMPTTLDAERARSMQSNTDAFAPIREEARRYSRPHNMTLAQLYKLYQGALSEERALAQALEESLKTKSPYGLTKLSQGLPQNMYYLDSEHQGDTLSCGSRSVIHAKAIEQLIADDAVITAQSIKNYLQSMKHHINNDELEIMDLLLIGTTLNIKSNLYYTQYKKDRAELSCAGSGFNNELEFSECFEALKNGTCPLAFFICNTGAHWVTVAAQNVNGKIHLIYLNSMNSPLVKDSMTYLTLNTLSKKLGL